MNKCVLNQSNEYFERITDAIIFESSIFQELKDLSKGDMIEMLKAYAEDPQNQENIQGIKLFENIEDAVTQVLDKDFLSKPDQGRTLPLDINLKNPSQMIPILNSKLNNKLYALIKNEFIAATFYDGDQIVYEENLHTALIKYKSKLFSILTGNKGINYDYLFNWVTNKNNYNRYVKILQETQLSLNLRLVNGKIDNEEYLNIIKALYVLTNFDELIIEFAPNIVINDYNSKNKIKVTIGKYGFKLDTLISGNYDDSEMSASATRMTSQRLKNILETIDKNGEKLRYQEVASIIRDIVYTYNHRIKKDIADTKKNSREKFEEYTKLGLGHKNQMALNALKTWLERYDKVYNHTLKLIPILERDEFIKNYDLYSILLQQIQNEAITAFLEVSGNKIDIKCKALYQDSKKSVRNILKRRLLYIFLNNLAEKEFLRLNQTYNGFTAKELLTSNPIAPSWLLTVTGINYSYELCLEIFKPETIGKFLYDLQYEVAKKLLFICPSNELESRIDKIIEDLSIKSSSYITFSDCIVQQHPNNKSTIMSIDGRELPGTVIHNTISDFMYNVDNTLFQNNVLIHNNNSTPIVTISAVSETQSNHRKIIELNEEELMELGLNLYLNPVQDKATEDYGGELPNYAYFLIDAVSDKPNVPHGAGLLYVTDKDGKINVNRKGMLLQSRNELIKIWQKLQKEYYDVIMSNIINDFSALFDVKFLTYEEVFKYIEDNNITGKELETAIASYQLKGGNILIVKDKHYCIDKNIIYPNSRLYYYYKIFNDNKLLNSYITESFNAFKNEIQTIKGLEKKIKEAPKEYFFETDKDVNEFLGKYFLIRNIYRDAYLNLTINPSFFHDNKGELLTCDLLKLAFNNISDLQNQTSITHANIKWDWSRYASNNYELSSQGDSRFSALNAKFKSGTILFGHDVSNRTIESVYQHGVKLGNWDIDNNFKTGRPNSKEIIKGNTENDSYYEGYLPLWQEWAKQNPELIKELREKSAGKVLTDQFASTAVSQARALADILNENIENTTILSFKPTSILASIAIDLERLHKKNSKETKEKLKENWINDKNYIDDLIKIKLEDALKAGVSSLDLQISNIDLLKAEKGFEEHVVYLQNEIKKYNNPFNILKINISQTAIAGKKRGNSPGASFVRPLINTQYGILGSARFAIINEPKGNVYTNFGDTDQKGTSYHDGVIWSDAIYQEFETLSFRGITPKGRVRKNIFLDTHVGHLTQIKCSDQCITNAHIRNSSKKIGQAAYNETNFKLLKRKMLSPAGLGSFKENLAANENNIDFEIYYQFRNGIAKLTTIGVDENNNILLNWEYLSNGKLVGAEDVQTLFDDNVAVTVVENGENAYQAVGINNLYQLWQAFGGEFAKDYDYIDNPTKFSEKNNQIIAKLISSLNAQDIKTKMIAKVVNPSAVKSSMVNVNSIERVYDESEPLIYFDFNNLNYGLQQDYTHESNESESPFPTLVLSALAFNGENIEYCNKIYEAFGLIVENSLNQLPSYDNKKATSKWLGKKLLHSFKHSSMSSSGELIVTSFLKELEKEEVILPASDPDIYYKLTLDIISSMNSNTIRLTLTGAGLIQCPSKGVMLIYLDKNGKKYTRTDLYNIAQKYLVGKAQYSLQHLTYDQALDIYLTNADEFLDSIISSIKDLNISDSIVFVNDIINKKGEIIYKKGDLVAIDSPMKLYEILEYAGEHFENIKKSHKTPRDLATTQITWDYNVLENDEIVQKSESFWGLWSTRAIFTNFKNFEQKEYYRLVNIDQTLALKLHKFYTSEADYKAGILTDIFNYKYKPGEQIAPKQYKNRLGLQGSMSDVTGPDYFQQLLKDRFEPSEFVGIRFENVFTVCTAPLDFKEDQSRSKEFFIGDINSLIDDENQKYVSNTYVETNEYGENILYSPDGEMLLHLPEGVDYTANVVIKNNKYIVVIDTKNPYEFLDLFDKNNSVFYSPGNTNIDLSRYNRYIDPTEEGFSKAANYLYNSFLLSNRTLSLRIPTQSFQSFLSAETVAFTETDENLVYNNIWEMIFQGSDFDIDKAYTIMYHLDHSGLITGNVFTDYRSMETIKESFHLPLPDYNKCIEFINNKETSKQIDDHLISLLHQLYQSEINQVIINDNGSINLLFPNDVRLYKFLEAVLELDIKNYYIGGAFAKLFKKINEYNGLKYDNKQNKYVKLNRNVNYIKNIITEGMISISEDIANLPASLTLMEVNSMTDHILKEKRIESEANPMFVFRTQYENAVGRVDIGIAANGMKVGSALQQFYNLKFQDVNNVEKLKLNISGSFVEAGVDKQTITHIANLKLSDEVLRKLYKEQLEGSFNVVPKSLDEIKAMLRKQEDSAVNSSILLSLAVDNAKELALASMYGYPDLFKFHVALTILGFSKQEIVKISQTYLKPIVTAMRNSKSRKPNISSIVKQLSGISEESRQSLLDVFSFADAITETALLLKINLKISPKYYDFDNLLNKFSSYIQSTGINVTLEEFILGDNQKDIIESLYLKNSESGEYQTKFNILDVVTTHPIFSNLLKTIVTHSSLIRNNIIKASIFTDIKEKLKQESYSKLNIKDSTIIQIIDDYVTGESLKLAMIQIPVRLLKLMYNASIPANLGSFANLDLTTNKGLEHFINIMNSNIIPYLKELLPDNFFLYTLQRINDLTYTLPYTTHDTKDSPSLKADLERCKIEFEQFAYMDSGLTSNGEILTFADLFYLYQLIEHKDNLGSGVKYCIKESALKTKLSLPAIKQNAYKDLDSLDRISAEYQQITSLIFKYVEAVQNDGATHNSGVVFNVKNSPVITFSPLYLIEANLNKPLAEIIKDHISSNIEIEGGYNSLERKFVFNISYKGINNTLPSFIYEYPSTSALIDPNECELIIADIDLNVITLSKYLNNNYPNCQESNTTIEDILKNVDDKYKEIKEFFNNSDIKIYTTSKDVVNLPRYLKQGNKEIIITNNSSHLSNEEFLLDILLQSKSNSLNAYQKLYALIDTVIPPEKQVEEISFNNYNVLLDLYQDELKNNETFKLGVKLLTNQITEAYDKTFALETILKYEYQLLNSNLFYSDKIEITDIENGDIVIDEKGLEILILSNFMENTYIGVNMEDVSTITTVTINNKMFKRKPLIVTGNLLNINPNPNLNKVEISDITKNSIKLGDKINDAVVTNILYDKDDNTAYYIVYEKDKYKKLSKDNIQTLELGTSLEIIGDYKYALPTVSKKLIKPGILAITQSGLQVVITKVNSDSYYTNTGQTFKLTDFKELRFTFNQMYELDPVFLNFYSKDIRNIKSDYYRVNNNNLNIGDIYTDGNNSAFIKILDIIGDKIIVLNTYKKFNKTSSKIEEWTKDHGNFLMPFHYTKDKELFESNGVINEVETVYKFLDTLSNKTGIPILIDNETEEVVNDKLIKAKLTNDGIVIFTKGKSDKEIAKYLLNESTHEFVHVLFAMLRKSNPEKYLEIVVGKSLINSKESLNLNELDLQELEELTVLELTETIQKAINVDSIYRLDNIIRLVNRTFSELLGFNVDITLPLGTNLERSDFLVKTMIDFNHLFKNTLDFETFKKINKECK